MRWVAGSIATAIAVFLAGSVLAQGGAAKVDWKVGPSEGDMFEVYPVEAGLKRISGQVVLRCEGATDGRLDKCAVVSETPEKIGFGQAALALAGRYRLKSGPAPAFEFPVEFGLGLPAVSEGLELPTLFRMPTEQQRYQAWPAEARALGLEGEVDLRCVVNEQGFLRDCALVKESRGNIGFAVAAAELTKLYRYAPASRDGKAVPISTPVNIRFRCGDRCKPLDVQDLTQPLAVRVRWAQAPVPQDVAAVYPASAGAAAQGGKVVLDCDLRADGSLRGCKAASEEPEGAGFAASALKLAPLFKAMTAPGVNLNGAKVFIPVAFTGRPLDTGTPDWRSAPTRAEFAAALPLQAREKNLAGSAELDCVVSRSGGLENCRVVSETPAGMGFGAAALSLQPRFGLTLWSADGKPTAGARVRAPIAFEPPQQMATGGARIPEVTNPEWASRPTVRQLGDAYPIGALRGGYGGQVVLRCVVQATGGVTGCKVVREEPTGLGFGDAALRLSRYFRMKPMMVDGTPVMPDGAEVEFPVGFRLQ